MARLSIDVLGSLQVTIADTPVSALESVKVSALLAYLAVESNQPHQRESLVGLLWPDYPEESARHNLRQALFNLRKMLGDHTAGAPYLLISRDTIQFNQESDYSLDIEQFNHYFFTCEDHRSQCTPDCSIHASNLEKMVKLYRGEFLHGIYVEGSTEFEEWTLVQQENIHQRVIEAHGYLANYYEMRSEFQAARRHAMRQLVLDPWREEAHRQMMRVLALNGERSAALTQYELCKQVLAEELDVEPSAETRELYDQIRLGTLHPYSSQAPIITSTPIHNIPIQLTPFIGRELELGEVGELITDPGCRCVTFLGPGGIGKTRLAVRIAEDHLSEFIDGVAFVSLASVGSMAGVIPAITNAINLSFYGPGEPKEHLMNHLGDKEMLLILDNVEHLLIGTPQEEVITQLIIELMQKAAKVKLLVTSREALNIQGEWLYEVQGLTFPSAMNEAGFDEYDAIALFIQRARRALPGFSLNDENRKDIAQICHLVEGMPLAIELAATWMRLLTPAEIAREIADNLDFLSSSLQDIPERHRSMRAVFEQSWQMLSTSEQNALARLSVFRGGFQRQAAEQVAGASLTFLSTLYNRSLMRRTAAGRYDLHELIRQYCATQLAIDPQVKAATQELHYSYYLALAETANNELKGHHQLEWLDRLEQEHDNLRAALEWALEHSRTISGEDERTLRLPVALRWFWRMRGHFHEGCDWLKESLQQCLKCQTATRAGALLGISLLTNALGDLGAARQPAEESVDIYRNLGDQPGLAEALMIYGLTLLWQGEASPGHDRTKEALAIYQSIGDKWGEAHALYRLGSALSDYGGDPAGKAMLEESAAILESLGEKYLYTSVLISLGIVDLGHGDYGTARQRFEIGLAATRELKHPWGIADALTNLGCLFRIQGEYAKAQSCFEQALRVYQEHGRNIWETDVICAMAENAIVQGDLTTAKNHLQVATSILGTSHNEWLKILVLYFQGLVAFYETDDTQAGELLNEAIMLERDGHFMPDLARSLVSMGLLKIRLGELRAAGEYIHEALALYWKFDHKLGVATALEAYTTLYVVQAKYESAVEQLAVASKLRQVLGAARAPIDCNSYDSMVSSLQNRLEIDTFNDLWRRAETKSLVEAVGKTLHTGTEN